jgi:hypothetical protein
MIGLLLSAVLTLAPAGAAQPTGPTVELYGVTSGFAKARTDRISITVGPMLDTSAEDSNAVLDPVLDAWNRAAGWQLFIFDPDARETADVIFVDIADHDSCALFVACTGWAQFPTGWYRQARIALAPGAPVNTIAHELGHALGFEDVELTTDYRGIMSYARDRTLLPDQHPEDIASLAAVGYRS